MKIPSTSNTHESKTQSRPILNVNCFSDFRSIIQRNWIRKQLMAFSVFKRVKWPNKEFFWMLLIFRIFLDVCLSWKTNFWLCFDRMTNIWWYKAIYVDRFIIFPRGAVWRISQICFHACLTSQEWEFMHTSASTKSK